jgi:hypothetical protein
MLQNDSSLRFFLVTWSIHIKQTAGQPSLKRTSDGCSMRHEWTNEVVKSGYDSRAVVELGQSSLKNTPAALAKNLGTESALAYVHVFCLHQNQVLKMWPFVFVVGGADTRLDAMWFELWQKLTWRHKWWRCLKLSLLWSLVDLMHLNLQQSLPQISVASYGDNKI